MRVVSWAGRSTPSDTGLAMYPRASDLGSADVQAWSDAELFWIIQNGIRLTGMPGFSKQHWTDGKCESRGTFG